MYKMPHIRSFVPHVGLAKKAFARCVAKVHCGNAIPKAKLASRVMINFLNLQLLLPASTTFGNRTTRSTVEKEIESAGCEDGKEPGGAVNIHEKASSESARIDTEYVSKESRCA